METKENYGIGWDKTLTIKLLSWGLSREQAGLVVGEVAEQRQISDRLGYGRGYEKGYHNAEVKYKVK